jgi:hypothetical protein
VNDIEASEEVEIDAKPTHTQKQTIQAASTSSLTGCDFGSSSGSRGAPPQRLARMRGGSESEVSDGAKSEVQRR